MEQMVMQEIVATKTVNDIEMGVLRDGTAYLTGRSLARLCGVVVSAIIKQKDQWEAGNRTGAFAKRLLDAGFDKPSLAIPIKTGASGVAANALAYPEEVVMAFLDYYAFDYDRPIAKANYRVLARAGFRLFVYAALGFDPLKKVPSRWREFHDRLAAHVVPIGYYSVFREMADFILLSIQNGFDLNFENVPDISVGRHWSTFWKKNGLAEKYGAAQKYDHNYPEYFPQSASNPQDMLIYPVASLGEFRTWFQEEYVPYHFPDYIEGKVKRGALPASTAELLLAAVEEPKRLPA